MGFRQFDEYCQGIPRKILSEFMIAFLYSMDFNIHNRGNYLNRVIPIFTDGSKMKYGVGTEALQIEISIKLFEV